MIVVDSSILVGIVKLEADSEHLMNILAAEDCAVGAPTLVETRIWCTINLVGRSSRWLEEFVSGRGASIVPFTREMADIASRAFAAFGRSSGHPAKLNFGDCMTYAVATVMKAPLLFKGDDFSRTDIMVHPASIRR